jgi:hypothetical protein
VLVSENSLSDQLWPGLVLLCKRPVLGYSKQRLAEQIGTERAFIIAQHLLACALEDIHLWPGHTVLAPDHQQHLAWSRGLALASECLAQGEGNLGERINQLDAQLRHQGHQSLIYIGSDCPALCFADYKRVSYLLQSNDSVLLSAEDGGVVLMASNLPWPDLCALPWSTPQLGEALGECCRQAGQRVAVAGQLFDIDHQQDLRPLYALLAADARPARVALRQALEQLGAIG